MNLFSKARKAKRPTPAKWRISIRHQGPVEVEAVSAHVEYDGTLVVSAEDIELVVPDGGWTTACRVDACHYEDADGRIRVVSDRHPTGYIDAERIETGAVGSVTLLDADENPVCVIAGHDVAYVARPGQLAAA